MTEERGDDAAKFTFGDIKQQSLKHDGTEPKNKYVVAVRVDGVEHTIRLRMTSSNTVRLPIELQAHPLAEEIRKAATQHFLDTVRARLRPLGEM